MKNILVISRVSGESSLTTLFKKYFNTTQVTPDVASTVVTSDYDLAIFPTFEGTTNQDIGLAQSFLQKGLSIIQCLMVSSTNTSGSFLFNLGVSSDFEKELSNYSTSIKTFQNNVLLKSNATNEVEIKYRNEATYFDYIDSVIDPNFIKLASSPQDSTKICFGLLPSGSTNTKIQEPTKANFWYAGFLIGGKNSPYYNEDAVINLITDILNYNDGLNKKYRISGTVGNSKQEPIARKLRAYNKTSGKLIAETISAKDGAYSIDLSTQDIVYLICLHDSADSNNSQIQDDIIPILVE